MGTQTHLDVGSTLEQNLTMEPLRRQREIGKDHIQAGSRIPDAQVTRSNSSGSGLIPGTFTSSPPSSCNFFYSEIAMLSLDVFYKRHWERVLQSTPH